jgi:hypothetical protein
MDGLSHNVYASVVQGDALTVREFVPEPNLLQFIAIGRNGIKHGLYQAFETVAFVGFGVGLITVAVDYFLEIAHDAWYLSGGLPFQASQKEIREVF